MKIPRFIAKVRAKALLIVNPKHYETAISLRKGMCKKCCICCGDCKHLTKNGCDIYRKKDEKGNYLCCFDFPRDDFDLIRIGVKGICGYYW